MKGAGRLTARTRGGERARHNLPAGASRKYLFIGVTQAEHQAVKTYCASLGLEYNSWIRGLIFSTIDEGQIREARATIHRAPPETPTAAPSLASDGGMGSPGRGVTADERRIRELEPRAVDVNRLDEYRVPIIPCKPATPPGDPEIDF